MKFTHPPYVARPIPYSTLTEREIPNWGYVKLGMQQVELTRKGKGTLVAIVDDSANFIHEDVFDLNLYRADYSGNFTAHPDDDARAHGVACAAIACGLENGKGSLGYAPLAQRAALKVLGKGASTAVTGSTEDIRASLDFLLQKGRTQADGSELVGIINMSLGGPHQEGFDPLGRVVRELIEDGWIIFAAAGNTYNKVTYPGTIPELITVASFNAAMEPSVFSAKGKRIDIAMPGERIYSAWGDNQYVQWDGTSAAAPAAAGVCAALCSEFDLKNQKEFLQFVGRRHIDISYPGDDILTGKGYYDVPAIIEHGNELKEKEEEEETETPKEPKNILIEVKRHHSPIRHIKGDSKKRLEKLRALQKAKKHFQYKPSVFIAQFIIPAFDTAAEVSLLSGIVDDLIKRDLHQAELDDFIAASEWFRDQLIEKTKETSFALHQVKVSVQNYAKCILSIEKE